MPPKIDYKLIGEAVEFYTNLGYEYVELPWAVDRCYVYATLPEEFDSLGIGLRHPETITPYYSDGDYLVGSAEQSFIASDMEPGRYVGVTPCFRAEIENNLYYQDMFMKVELFDNRPDATVEEVITDAEAFFRGQINPLRLGRDVLRRVVTGIGVDLNVGTIEVGSYGERTHEDFGRWVYGTGLACPRFSVARALAEVM